MSTGAWILVVALVLAVGLGLARAFTDGRFRGTHRLRKIDPVRVSGKRAPASVDRTPRDSVLSGTRWESHLGERATLLQFSSAFCAPCRRTRHVLADVAARSDGVTHVEVDAEHHLDLVRRLAILRTPTTLVLDREGAERTRATGAPRPEQVQAALDQL